MAAVKTHTELGDGGVINMLEQSDLLETVVPASRRDSKLKMTLLWITFQASVSNMYTGYLARSSGLSLGKLFLACAIATVVMIGYCLLAANVGTFTGQAHSVLARSVLGKSGSGLASVLLVITGMGWYGFQAVFLAQLFQGLFGLTHLQLFCAVFAILMITNNLLGFRSVSGYARFVAAPILLVWGSYAIIKAFSSTAGPHLFAAPHVTATQGLFYTVELLVGVAMFGNEPDIFRYARRRDGFNALPLGVGYGLGLLVFPVAGYLMAELSNASTLGQTMHFFIKFSMFGLLGAGIVIFTVSVVALNDANLYEAVNAVQNTLKGRWRAQTVISLGVVGAVLAVFMERSNSLQNNFFTVAGICAVCLPCATIVMALDVFLLERISGCRRRAGTGDEPRALVSWAEASPGNIAGIVAILAGVAVGGWTGGLIPWTSGFQKTNIGIPALEAWSTAIIVYVGAMVVARYLGQARAKEVMLGLPRQDELVINLNVAPATADSQADRVYSQVTPGVEA
jgi:purine-cytosine permease-like protein